jgi:hypothetical protein
VDPPEGGERMYRCAILVLVLAGCATQQSPFQQSPFTFTQPADIYRPAEYPYYFDAVQADLFWRCATPEGGGVRVEGYALSDLRSNLPIYDFQVQLFARDAKGEILADRWTRGDRTIAARYEPIPFAISLPTIGEGVHYDLYYWFQIPSGNGGRGADRGPEIVLARTALQPVSWTIEDVCDDRWRRSKGK